MAQSWDVDPRSGDYLMDGGDPVQTDSLRIPAYIRLKVKRRGWLYAPDAEYGSDFHLVKKRKTNENATIIESMGARALQPIADDGRASQITVDAVDVARHGIGLQADISDAAGNVERLVLPQI